MKILSEEEFKKELDKIVTYGDNDIAIGIEDLHRGIENHPFKVECLDTEDINQITNNKDLIIMSSSEYCGSNSAVEVIKSIILDFEKNKFLIRETDGILVYFQVNLNYKIMSFADAVEIIYDKCEYECLSMEPDIIWGVSCDNDFEDDYVKATVFVSYSKKRKLGYANNCIL
ncbi:MAG: hypothetical protein GXP61_09035 [Epsilonproteobacteria bacterium]|nr:hypothetical protein [Campylobacterota bacterium]